MAQLRTDRRRLIGIVVFAAVVLVSIALSFRAISAKRTGSNSPSEQYRTALDLIQKRNAKVQGVTSRIEDDTAPLVTGIDLSGCIIDNVLLEAVCRITSLERLTLDRTDVRGEDLKCLSQLSSLRSLSLSNATIDDLTLQSLGRFSKLQHLSVSGTALSEPMVTLICEIPSLSSLDVSGTNLTPAQSVRLASIRSLKSLTIDDGSIDSESIAGIISSGSLTQIEVIVENGLGASTHHRLSNSGTLSATARRRSGELLWNSATPWNDTPAGTVDAVGRYSDLSPSDVVLLLELAANQNIQSPQVIEHERQTSPVVQMEVESVDEFLRHLVNGQSRHLKTFARERFTAKDLSTLYAVLQSEEPSDHLVVSSTLFLSEYGADNPEAMAHLDKLLNDNRPRVRAMAINGFGEEASDMYFGTKPSANIVKVAVPRIISWCADEDDVVRRTASRVIGDLGYHHPSYAADLLPGLVSLLRIRTTGYTSWSLSRIANSNTFAAINVLPELRQLLEDCNSNAEREQILEAMCVVAAVDPVHSEETARVYLDLLRSGKVANGDALAALVRPENRESVNVSIKALIEMNARQALAAVISEVAKISAAAR